jgi:hypothetical protein
MTRATVLLTTIAVAAVAPSAVAAATTFGDSPVPPGVTATTASTPAPVSITQNLEPAVIEAGSPACQSGGITTDNWFGRVYDLDGDHALTGEFCVTALEYAIESASHPTPTTFQVSCLPQGTAGTSTVPLADLDASEVFSVTIDSGPAQMEFLNQPLGGCCVAEESDLAVFVVTADCLDLGTCGGWWPGSNGSGQIRDWYIAAPDCGIDDPIASAALGFPPNLVQVVHGEGTLAGDGGGDDVPAAGAFGSVALLLFVLGSGVLLLRRRGWD